MVTNSGFVRSLSVSIASAWILGACGGGGNEAALSGANASTVEGAQEAVDRTPLPRSYSVRFIEGPGGRSATLGPLDQNRRIMNSKGEFIAMFADESGSPQAYFDSGGETTAILADWCLQSSSVPWSMNESGLVVGSVSYTHLRAHET